MSIRKMLGQSRRSGPATVYELDKDGVIVSVKTRPAREPTTPGKLTQEERLCILTQTGSWPEDLPAEAGCGVQANDVGYSIFDTRRSLDATGIMFGPSRDKGASHD